MENTGKYLLIGAILLLVGAIIFTVALSLFGWDFSKIATSKLETNEHIPTEDFTGIKVTDFTASITVHRSENGKCKVVCEEFVNVKHTVEVVDGILTVSAKDTRRWYEYIGINFKNAMVDIYLPKSEYDSLTVSAQTSSISVADGFAFGNIDVKTSTGNLSFESAAIGNLSCKTNTGNIRLNDVTASAITLSVTTGNVFAEKAECAGELKINASSGHISLQDVSCGRFSAELSTGDVTMKNLISASSIYVKTTTGNIYFEKCDAESLNVTASTGKISGSLLTPKSFDADSTTGRVQVPRDTAGGSCKIRTSTGDIIISIAD